MWCLCECQWSVHSTICNFWCQEIECGVEKRWSYQNCIWFEPKRSGWFWPIQRLAIWAFFVHTVGTHPLLMLLDGHSSHYQPKLTTCARKFGVIIFCLPPYTMHKIQPLYANVFKLLKQNEQHACHNFIQSNPSMNN